MNWKKINLYILFSCAFSWTVALIMKLVNISVDTILGTIFLAVLYMPGPALATLVIQKYIYKGGFKQYGWRLESKAIKWILFTPLFFLALTFLTFGFIALFGNTDLIPAFGQVSFSQENFDLHLRELATGKIDLDKVEFPSIPPKLAFTAMLGQGIIAGSTFSLPFMFGEEFGWRGLMFKETLRMGFPRACAFIGLVWGIWHAPIILMGHNYPHHPYVGVLMMCLFTIAMTPLFIYVRIKTKSILGPCMFHGMLNASGPLYVLFIANRDELYSSVAGWAGIIAGIGLTICILIFDKKIVEEYSASE